MSLPLTGKRALITGSSHGVGLAAAHLFAAQGAEVVLHGNANMADADKAVQDIGPAALGAVQADLSRPGGGRELYDAALHLASGRLDIIVNNAGIHPASPLDASDAEWEAVWALTLQVNLMAMADICRAAIPEMAASGGGSIINIASRAGYRGEDRNHMAYAASKGAVLAPPAGSTRAWARSTKPTGPAPRPKSRSATSPSPKRSPPCAPSSLPAPAAAPPAAASTSTARAM